jgi:hypothetical protein
MFSPINQHILPKQISSGKNPPYGGMTVKKTGMVTGRLHRATMWNHRIF